MTEFNEAQGYDVRGTAKKVVENCILAREGKRLNGRPLAEVPFAKLLAGEMTDLLVSLEDRWNKPGLWNGGSARVYPHFADEIEDYLAKIGGSHGHYGRLRGKDPNGIEMEPELKKLLQIDNALRKNYGFHPQNNVVWNTFDSCFRMLAGNFSTYLEYKNRNVIKGPFASGSGERHTRSGGIDTNPPTSKSEWH